MSHGGGKLQGKCSRNSCITQACWDIGVQTSAEVTRTGDGGEIWSDNFSSNVDKNGGIKSDVDTDLGIDNNVMKDGETDCNVDKDVRGF